MKISITFDVKKTLLIALYGSNLTQATLRKFTVYWMTAVTDYPISPNIAVRTCPGEDLGKVSSTFWGQLVLQGSGIMEDGTLVACRKPCRCVEKIPYPFGADGYRLYPLVTAAANDLEYGTKLVVKQLVGLKLPDGQVHNGCVVVHDRSYLFFKNTINLFAFRKTYYEFMVAQFRDDLVDTVIDQTCELKNVSETVDLPHIGGHGGSTSSTTPDEEFKLDTNVLPANNLESTNQLSSEPSSSSVELNAKEAEKSDGDIEDSNPDSGKAIQDPKELAPDSGKNENKESKLDSDKVEENVKGQELDSEARDASTSPKLGSEKSSSSSTDLIISDQTGMYSGNGGYGKARKELLKLEIN